MRPGDAVVYTRGEARYGATVVRRALPDCLPTAASTLEHHRSARSRLYRSEILQEDMRLKALAEIYTMLSFAQLWNLNCFCQKCATHYAESCKIRQILF